MGNPAQRPFIAWPHRGRCARDNHLFIILPHLLALGNIGAVEPISSFLIRGLAGVSASECPRGVKEGRYMGLEATKTTRKAKKYDTERAIFFECHCVENLENYVD
jgi:hypothetical protein